MNKDSFHKWLKVIKKYDQETCSSIIRKCQEVETNYGDLDQIYAEDKFESLREKMFIIRQQCWETH